MKLSARLLCMALTVLAFVAIATEAGAQTPQCNDSTIVIRNPTKVDALVCIKRLNCFFVAAGTKTAIPVPPGTTLPGIYGAANVTHAWQPSPIAPYAYWIPSVQMLPSNRCFNVFLDVTNCIIDLELVPGPPCQNP